MPMSNSGIRYPECYQPIKRRKTIRSKAPLVEAASITLKLRMDVSEEHPTHLDHVNTMDVFQTQFNFKGSRMIVGSTHSLELPCSSRILVLSKPEEMRFVVGKILESLAKKRKSPNSEMNPEMERFQAQKDRKKLVVLTKIFEMKSAEEEFKVPDVMVLFDSIMISRIDAIIDFSFGDGFSYKVSRAGTNVPHLVKDPHGQFLNFGDTGFVKIEKSDQPYGMGEVVHCGNETYFSIKG